MKKWLIPLLYLVLSGLISPHAMAYKEISDDGFATGTLAGWSATPNVSVVAGVAGADGNAVKVTEPAGEGKLSRPFSPLSQTAAAEFRVMTDSLNAEKTIRLSNYNESVIKHFAILKFTTDGKLKAVLSGGETTLLDTVQAGVWYHIKLMVRVSGAAYDIYVDNKLVLAGVARYDSGATNVSYFAAAAANGSNLYMDSIRIYEPGPYAFDENFESNTMLAGWTTTSASVVSGVSGANGSAVKLSSPTVISRIAQPFPALTDTTVMRFRAMTSATNKIKELTLSNNNGGGTPKHFAYLRWKQNGTLVAVQASNEKVLLSHVAANHWYDIRIEADVVRQSYNVYIDNVLVLTGITPYAFIGPELSLISAWAAPISDLYVDDIQIYGTSTSGTMTVKPTFSSVSVTLPYADFAEDPVAVNLQYRKTGDTAWKQALAPVFDYRVPEFRGSIVSLSTHTTYDVKAEFSRGGTVVQTYQTTFTTWNPTPTIAQTIPIASIYSGGQLVLDNYNGSATGWIKIVGDGTTVVDGQFIQNAALKISNSSYLILENLIVRGGSNHGITIASSSNIRIIGSDIAGFGRVIDHTNPNTGLHYDSSNQVIADDSGIKFYNSGNIVIERNYIHDPRNTSNPWEAPNGSSVHPQGPTAVYMQSGTGKGGIVIRYNDFIGSDEHRWNDGIASYGNGNVDGGLYGDSDIHGNMFAFGNDDGIELDGGQTNTRLFRNKFEGFYQGLSTAPNMKGPSYVFENVVTNLGDQDDQFSSAVKSGGGYTYNYGTTFFFNNTFYGKGQGIQGVGYGDEPIPARKLYHAVTRNNLIVSARSGDRTLEDEMLLIDNDFDYDLLGNTAKTDGKGNTLIAAGSESHGLLGLPSLVNAVNGDFRPQSGSLGVNAGVIIPNFAEVFSGSAPDMGAFEYGAANRMIPFRPIPITANKYQLNLSGSASQTVTLTIGNISGGSKPYAVRKNDSFDWLNVTPASGTLTSNSTVTFTVSANTALMNTNKEKAVFLIRQTDGNSVPITVYATKP